MSDCFDLLPESIKARLITRPGHKEWKHCAMCSLFHGGAVKLRICSGCQVNKGEPVYYCSTECQRADWPNHKEFCLRGSEQPFPDDDAMKLLSRWLAVNYKVVRWCLEQLYYYNPTADPRKTFICLHLDGRTMAIHKMCLQAREGHVLFRDKRASEVESDTHFHLVELEASSSHKGCYKMTSFLSDALSMPEVMKKVVGYPQWPWITTQITSTLQKSSILAERRLMLLCAVIRVHTANEALSVGRSLIAPQLAPSIDVTPAQMMLWRLKLGSIELWKPLKDSPSLVASIFHDCCPLTHTDTQPCIDGM